MNRIVLTAVLMAAIGLSGCADKRKDYEASAKCQGMGHKAGTAEYDQCMREEATNRMMQQQRDEYEHMKQDQRDWSMRRYN